VAQLFTPELRRTTIVTTIMFAFAYGAAFGAIQQMPRIVPGLPEVSGLAVAQQQQTASWVQAFQEVGGLVGRFVLAFLAIRIVSRRRLIHIFQIPGLIVVPLVFAYAGTTSLNLAQWGMFFAGLFTVAQFSFWGNYLPRVFPTHLRGTGEGFAANIGGRMLGTGFAFVTTQLANITPGNTPPARLAYAAAIVALGVYLGGFIASWWLPEPKGTALPE
jgi:MFS family permease